MTVLSEDTIRNYISRGEIVVDGDPQHVRGSSYSFHIHKIIPGGDQEEPSAIKDWSVPKDGEFYRIQPQKIVWILIRELIKMPNDVCAFWWQTNTLARKGLMLVNMSMVDPGYGGSLACLFVNFGRKAVEIDPNTPIARLVFHRMDHPATPYGLGDAPKDYERNLRGVAYDGPSSFLSLEEFSAAFQDEKAKAFTAFQSEARDFSNELRADLREKTEAQFKAHTDNVPSLLKWSFGYAAIGFVVLTLAISFAPWVKDQLGLDVGKRIDTAVEAAIGKRLQPVATVDTNIIKTLDERIRGLEAELRALKQPKSGDGAAH